MKKVYTVLQGMWDGTIRVCEWDIIKETLKTVSCGFPQSKDIYFQKNKSMFNTVHLNSKRNVI